jgi:hypothetical protein
MFEWLLSGEPMDQIQIVVCKCGVAVRVRELRFDIGGIQERDWAPCPWCYCKLYEMKAEGVVVAEPVTKDEWG